MIHLNFGLSNPFSSNRFNNVWIKHGLLIGHKAWELEIHHYAKCLLNFEFRLSFREDHAGVSLALGLFGYIFSAQIYDTRHWDETTWKM